MSNQKQEEKLLYSPALYIPTQTTIPILSQIMAGISIALIPIGVYVQHVEIIWCVINTKYSALALFGISGLLFWVTVEACINSQSWDYFALSKERRDYENLSTDKIFIRNCMDECQFWHRFAIYSYRAGSICIMFGVLILLWPFSHSIITVIVIILVFISISFKIYKLKRMRNFQALKD